MNYLEIKNLHKRYAGTNYDALRGVSLSINQGEIVYMVGESGSGKTTLLRVVAGFERPDCGSISLGGVVVSNNSKNIKPENRSVGIIFQNPSLFPQMTVEKNVAFGLSGMSKTERQKRVLSLLDLVGLTRFKDRYPGDLSGGQQQRVALIRSLAVKPSLMLFDEAFSQLDESLRDELLKHVKTILRTEKLTGIFVSHSAIEALNIADKIIILKDGTLQQFGTPLDIRDNPINLYVARMFGRCNIFNGVVNGDKIDSSIGTISNLYSYPNGMRVKVCINPEHLDIADCSSSSIPATVSSVCYLHGYKELNLQILDQDKSVRILLKGDVDATAGSKIFVKPQRDKIKVYPEET